MNGVTCGNCGKEGNTKDTFYKIVGYPIGHPLHGKYQPPRPQRKSQEYKPNGTLNMATTQESSSAQPNTPSEAYFSTRIDLLQNQLNQVLRMMQNNQKDTVHDIFSSTSITIPKFIASLVSNFKSTWIIDSGAIDHISITLTLMINIQTFTTPILVTLPNGHTVIQNKSPYELLYNTPPPMDHLRTIGCRAYLHQHTSDKFHPRSIPTILIGYPPHQKGYLLYDPITSKIHTSRHVQFDETQFPFHNPTPPNIQITNSCPTPDPTDIPTFPLNTSSSTSSTPTSQPTTPI
ncbi:cysteine-rich receptor-like protein kinase 8 [Tanacetum coccineum]